VIFNIISPCDWRESWRDVNRQAIDTRTRDRCGSFVPNDAAHVERIRVLPYTVERVARPEALRRIEPRPKTWTLAHAPTARIVILV
jgi:hypothetical protein